MWCGRWERPRNDSGASGIEYGSLILVAALIIVSLVTATTNTVSPATKSAICSLFQDGCSTPTNGTSPTSPNSDPEAPSNFPRNSGEDPSTPSGNGPSNAADPNNWGPKWNNAYPGGADPFGPAWRALTDQVNAFFDGINSFLKNSIEGLAGAIWDDLTGIGDLVTNPVQSAKGIWWAITNPGESLPLLVWDEESQNEWKNGSKVKAAARGVWNVGSWFIPGYDIGKALSKIGKFGKVAAAAGKAGKAADLAQKAAKAADRARQLAKKGDLPGARKAAEEARQKADEAREQAKGAGCKVVSLGPPHPGDHIFVGRFGGFVPTAGMPTSRQGCEDADGNGTDDTVDKARQHAAAAKTALQTALEKVYGIPLENQRKFQNFANRNGLTIDVRPTNPTSVHWLRSGALPKPEAIKAKTVNELDVLLGAQRGTEGLVGFFDPVLPPRGDMTDAQWTALKKRYDQRKDEYGKLKSKMDGFAKKGNYKVIDGIVHKYSDNQWKHITGDHDLFDIRKSDGTRLTRKEERRIITMMQRRGLPIEHGPHVYWKPDPNDEFSNSIRNKIIEQHGPGGEPLVRFSPNGELPQLVDSQGNHVPE